MKQQTLEIIKHLENGKTQWELYKMGYPFGTIRYHYSKLFRPEHFAKFLEKQKIRMKERHSRKKLSKK